MKLSVVVPMLNEASQLPALAAHLQLLIEQGAEVLLVDGGSIDASAAIATSFGLQVLRSSPGRAAQMNHGAAHTSGDALLFLHADTCLPQGAFKAIKAALEQHQWGRFDVRIEGSAAMLRVVAAFMNWRSRASAIATGDQAIFIRRSAFNAVGGFPDQALMEDIELCKRLRSVGAPACLRSKVVTSGRRWEARGVWRTIWLMWRLRWAYWRGVPAARLAQLYR